MVTQQFESRDQRELAEILSRVPWLRGYLDGQSLKVTVVSHSAESYSELARKAANDNDDGYGRRTTLDFVVIDRDGKEIGRAERGRSSTGQDQVTYGETIVHKHGESIGDAISRIERPGRVAAYIVEQPANRPDHGSVTHIGQVKLHTVKAGGDFSQLERERCDQTLCLVDGVLPKPQKT